MLTTLVATTRVAFTGAVNEQMTFGLASSQYVIKNIDGLGPVKAAISSSDNASDRGTTFLSARDGQRNIVITMGFAPTYSTGSTVETLRNALYDVFTPKMLVELTLTSDVLGTFDISGHVESHEPSIFSKEPEVIISILCDDPYFYKQAADIVYNFPLLVPGAQTFSVDYAGKVPVGYVFEFDILTDTSSTYLFLATLPNNTPETPYIQLTGVPWLNGDHFRISTVKGDRGVEYTRSSVTYDAMSYLTGSLVSMQLEPGLNYFHFEPVLAVTGTRIKNAKFTYKQVAGGL